MFGKSQIASLSPSSLLPSSSRERRAVCTKLRQSLAIADAEVQLQFEKMIDVLMPMPPNKELLSQITNVVIPNHHLDKLEALLSGGGGLDDWSRQLRPFNVSPVCGLVWSTSYIGYRCKTCSRNPNMSLCAECFRDGNHEGHESNMFKSSSGGTCDCGNASVMSPTGFCNHHGRASSAKAPLELTSTSRIILFRYFWRFIVYMRFCFLKIYHERSLGKVNNLVASPATASEVSSADNKEFFLPINIPSESESDVGKLCNWLESIAAVGYSAKEELVNALLDKEAYQHVNSVQQDTADDVEALGSSQWARAELFKSMARTLFAFSPGLAENYYKNKSECSCLLDELFQWLLAYRLPNQFLNFLLSLLPVRHYASAMTRLLASHYPVVSSLLCFNLKVPNEDELERKERRALAQRFLHVTVQLYSNQELAELAVFDCQGLDAQLASLIALLLHCSCTRRVEVENLPVVNTENRILNESIAYWPLVSDLYNLVVHPTIAEYFLRKSALLQKWIYSLALCHGMNSNQRHFKNHIGPENELAFSTAYSLELEACSAPLWLIAAQIEQLPMPYNERYTISAEISQFIITQISKLFLELEAKKTLPCAYEFSFHLPLHRALSALLHASQTTYDSDLVTKLILPVDLDEAKRKNIYCRLVQPLIQLQSVRSQINCNMWVRNGRVLRTKALAYAQTNFASSFIDLDLSLLQAVVIAGLSANCIISYILEIFHTLDSLSLLTLKSQPTRTTPFSPFFKDEIHNEIMLFESAVVLISQLASLHLLPSMNIVTQQGRDFYRHQLRREIVTQLCLADRTYSELIDFIPQRHIASVEMASHDSTGTTSADVDACIAEVADFKEPSLDITGQVQSGLYVLRDSIWLNGKDFDPSHVMLRSFRRKDYQTCIDRYVSIVLRQASMMSSLACSKQLWSPFTLHCDTEILARKVCGESRFLHAVVFCILYRHLHELNSSVPLATVPDMIVACALNLLEMGVASMSGCELLPTNVLECIEVFDCDFENGWYRSDNIFENLCQKISVIRPPSSQFQEELSRRRVSEMPQGLPNDDSWPGGGFDRAQLLHQFALPKVWSDSMHSEKIDQSMLSVLYRLKLHYQKQKLPQSCIAVGPRVDDAFSRISSVLDTLKNCNETCRNSIEQLENSFETSPSEANAPDESQDTTCSDPAKLAAKRRERILALMAKQQRQFLEQMVGEGESASKEMFGDSQSAEFAMEISSDGNTSGLELSTLSATQTFDCCICNISEPSTTERPFVVISMCQPSKVLHHRYDSEGPFDLPLPMASGASSVETLPHFEHSMAHARQVIANTICKFDIEQNRGSHSVSPESLVATSAFWPVDVHFTLCGSGRAQHVAHFDCHRNFLRVNRPMNNDALNNALENLFALGALVEDFDFGAIAAAAENADFALLNEAAAVGAIGGVANETIMAARELGEYGCPLCRQLCNCGVPLVPSDFFSDQNHQCDNLPDPPAVDSVERLRQIADYLDPKNTENIISQRRSLATNSHIFQALRQFQTDVSFIVKQSLDRDSTASALQSSGSPGLTSLLISLCYANFKFCRIRPAATEEGCSCQTLYPMVSCIAASCYILLTGELRRIFNALFCRLSGLSQFHSITLPLLAHDPEILLLFFTLSAVPFCSSSAYLTSIVQILFNLKVVQAIVKVAGKLSTSERDAWKNSGKSCLVSYVLKLGDTSKMFPSEQQSSPRIGVSCHTVWTPQALADAVRSACLPFLELAATLMCCLNHPQQQTCFFANEKAHGVSGRFQFYMSKLGLDAGVVFGSSSKELDPWEFAWFAVESDGKTSLVTSESNPFDDPAIPPALKMWFRDVEASERQQQLVSVLLPPMTQFWFEPRILRIPNVFDQLFHAVRPWRCNQCHRVPLRPGICLLCGDIVCFREVCCNRDSVFEAVSHSRKCGAGTSIILVVPTSCVYIIRGPRYTVWGSPYLDAHGEEDRDLKRGRPLRCSSDRMIALERQWLLHGFDRQLRHWSWHSNRL